MQVLLDDAATPLDAGRLSAVEAARTPAMHRNHLSVSLRDPPRRTLVGDCTHCKGERTMTQVGLLGTGLLGSGFVEGMLARGGVELTVWNRTRAKADALAAKGARVADTPADAVKGAERVHLVLLDDATVDEIIQSLRPSLNRDAVIIDHTTNLPRLTAERARELSAAGIAYLHAPVFMSPAAARTAGGMMMVAGPTALFDRVKEQLRPMTGELWHVGERPDLAAAYKLFGNAMILTVAGGLADIFHMADALGISRADAFGLFSRFKTEPTVSIRGSRIVEENFVATFTLETARKDARLMLESSDGQPMPVLSAVASRMDEVIGKGFGDLDLAALAKRGV
jgi:3-hydroxyisobutyrate dehydrogenase